MRVELIATILDSYASLIHETLDEGDPLRFERVVRLAKLAHQLHQQTSTRVGEMKIGHEGGLVHYDEDPEGNYVLGGLGNIAAGRPMHQADVIREVVGAFHPIIRVYLEREQETRLNKLFDLRARMVEAKQDVTTIDERIAKLTADLKEDQHADPSMVHPELLRGHPSGTDGPGELQGDRGEPERPGNGSAGQAAQDGHQEGVACCHGESGLERDDEGRSTHRQGRRCHCTLPETGS
jgi:hypothetical protein